MQRSRVSLFVAGIVGTLALIGAACAPAAKPASTAPQTQPQQQPAPQSAPKQPALAPQSSQEAPKAQIQQQPKEQKPAAGPASVNGIPLDPNAKKGGILRVAATSGEGPTFDNWEEAAGIPSLAQGPVTNQIVQNRTWGTPEDYQKGAYYEVVPDLAKSWEQSADGLSWTFKLFDGVQWSDGTKFTCKDTKFTLDSIRTGKGLNRSPRAVHFLAVKEITCADDLTMVIKLSRPKPSMLEMVAMGYNKVFPAHIYENNIKELREKPAKAGTGPFVLKQWVPGEKYIFERKADYWNKPFPYLDGIEVPLLTAQAAATAMRAGRVDLSSSTSIQSGAVADTLVKECKDCQFYPTHIPLSVTYLYVNHQRSPWNTPEVKDALSLAVDRQKAIKVQLAGWGVLPDAGLCCFPGTYWAMPPERVKQLPGYDSSDPAKNKEKAKALLSSAGYKPGDLKTSLFWWQSSSAAVPPITVKEDLEAIGIMTELQGLETARAYDKLTAAEFDIEHHGHYLGTFDPDVMFYEHFYTGSDRNYGRYSKPEVDRLIDEQAQTIDPEQRRQKVWQISEILGRDQAKILLSHGVVQPIYGPRVRGFMPSNVAMATYGPLLRFEHAYVVDK